tara:strand:- start:99 stop:362 length:264 start_codon:yes stop_codon:yes gene_type:complete
MPDKLENIRRKLRFRSLRRGTKESDMVIGGFAQEHLHDLDEAQLADFEALLDENDQDVLSWIIDMKPPPVGFNTAILLMLKNFKKKI